MKRKETIESDDVRGGLGRDEMNLAEFPIALLSSRPNRNIKTLQFEDRLWDKGLGGWVARRLTISASDKYGLPTALDDEVIVGLIQLTRESGFEDRRVFFSRYKLIRLLGWRNEGKSYTRLDTSMRRWLGVTLYYENAWWDKSAQAWVDEHFHMLDQVSIYDRQRQLRQGGVEELPLSMFVWNEVVFRSFQSGYLKRLDMELYRRLESPIAKRLYRLLDKRFYHKTRWQFDLRTFCCEHVGLSRTYDAAGLKRKLRPAISELAAAGYLKAMEEEQQFEQIGRGRWNVHFCRASQGRSGTPEREPATSEEAELVRRGVNAKAARELALQHDPAIIRRHLAAVDRITQENPQRIRSVPGFLVESIRNGYELSQDARGGRRQASPRRQARSRVERNIPQDEEARLARYIEGLAPEKLQSLQERALESPDPALADSYRRAQREEAGLLVELYRRLILQDYLRKARKNSKKSE